MPKASVPASPGMWAKAAHRLAAVIRLCGDGVMSKEVKMGGGGHSIYSDLVDRTACSEPTNALHMPKASVPALPGMWVKHGMHWVGEN